MKRLILTTTLLSAFSLASCARHAGEPEVNTLRLPAVPLVSIDPYTSAWSMSDNLYDANVKHWTDRDFPLIGVLKVDDVAYRFMGRETTPKRVIVPTSEQGKWTAKFTTSAPKGDWFAPAFNDANWGDAEGAFGTKENEPTAKTQWGQERIWVRRVIDVPEDLSGRNVWVEYSHDDDLTLYINGIKVVDTGNAARKNILRKLPEAVVATLKPGKNLIAAHCHNRVGHALLDFGLQTEVENMSFFDNAATQLSVNVQPTQTYYEFACGPVNLDLTFMAPLLMDDYEVLSRPVNYITYDVRSNDGKPHNVEIYFEASPAWALNQPLQAATCETLVGKSGLLMTKAGSVEQHVLGKKGDHIRIDWGYFYLAAEPQNTAHFVDDSYVLRSKIVDKKAGEQRYGDKNMAIIRTLGNTKSASGKILVGYDDLYSIQYFRDNLRPYWNRDGNQTIEGQFEKAIADYAALRKKCDAFDRQLFAQAERVGGRKYAELCASVYRQSLCAHKLVEAPNGDLLFLSKENDSNGSIGTVDITYPSLPLYLCYNTELAKGLMNHIFYYSESGRWTKPFPSHDVGTYPIANGQTYGGDMPVEESGNMLVGTAAVCTLEGNADYAAKHWDVLTVWADYLVEKGLDPENQLCTDDFAGHFAHNANLSVKAIMGIAAFGRMAEMLGKADVAAQYTAKAREMAAEWMKMADDGDHYRLTFDKPGTWSQKYNLVWDKLLKLDIFPAEVAEKELAYYLTKQNEYGLPLDNRREYTKTDWILWSATMSDDQAVFERLTDPVWKFYNETIDRVPMSDWVWTDKPNRRGFKARAVVGGFYIKMLEDKLLDK